MRVKYGFVALLASAITLFALQNGEPTSIRFLFWDLQGMPLASVILVSVASGMVLVGIPLWLDRWRLRGRVRTLEMQLGSAEARLAERGGPSGSRP